MVLENRLNSNSSKKTGQKHKCLNLYFLPFLYDLDSFPIFNESFMLICFIQSNVVLHAT